MSFTALLQAGEGVENGERDVVPELLRHVDAEALALVAEHERVHARERARGGQALEVEVGEAPHELLALEREPGERARRVVGEDAVRAEPCSSIGRVVAREQVAAAGREPDELLALERADESRSPRTSTTPSSQRSSTGRAADVRRSRRTLVAVEGVRHRV